MVEGEGRCTWLLAAAGAAVADSTTAATGLQPYTARYQVSYRGLNGGEIDGVLVAKLFHGSGYSQLVELFKKTFRVVKPIKPKASRDKSAETFLVGIGLKPA